MKLKLITIFIISLIAFTGLTNAGSITLNPSDNGTFTNFTPVGATYNWQCVSDSSDDTRVSMFATTGIYNDTYTIENATGVQSYDIDNISVMVRCWNTNANAQYAPLIYINGSTYNPSYGGVGISWYNYEYTWTTNPNTGNPWTWNEIDELEAGVTSQFTSGYDIYVQCSQVIITVNYDDEPKYPPSLISPANTSTVIGTYPPIAYDVSFTWENTAVSYRYQVARDSAFNVLAANGYTSSNTTTIALTDDYYYWRVAAYDPTLEIQSNYSDIFEFDLDLTAVGVTGTVIDGVVYEVTDAGDIAVDETIVYIYNNTWSSQQITGANGYYQFTDLANETYSIQATKQGYVDSNIELVTTVFNDTVTKNILIERRSGAGDQYDFHYVKYIVKDLLDNRYQDIDVQVFENDDVVSIFTTVTGTDGAATFILNRDQEYRLEFTNSSQNIDITVTHYPKDSEYNVYVDFSLQDFFDDEPKEVEEISISASTSEINGTHAYINVTYLDSLNETTALNFTLKQTDLTDPLNATTIDSVNLGATSNVTHSFIVSDYEGQAYYINIIGTHTTFGDIDRTIAVKFKGMLEDFGFAKGYLYLAIGLIIFGGSFFGAVTNTQGSFLLCIGTWVMIGLGWFDSLGSSYVGTLSLACALATVISLVGIFAKKDKEV